MKKFAAAILLLIYFAISTGFVVSVHYCMDKINGIELGHADNGDCDQCGMPMLDKDGCCKSEVKVVKMQVDQAIASMVTAGISLPPLYSHATDFLLTPLYDDLLRQQPVANGPPLSKQDTYLHNRVFRI